VDPRECYTVAGGRALRIPRVLAALGEAGWSGLPADLLAGAEPLLGCAGRLVSVGSDGPAGARAGSDPAAGSDGPAGARAGSDRAAGALVGGR
jgi:hypothetical protein